MKNFLWCFRLGGALVAATCPLLVGAADNSSEVSEPAAPVKLKTSTKTHKKIKRSKKRAAKIHKAEPFVFSTDWDSGVGYEWLQDVSSHEPIFDRPFVHQKVTATLGKASSPVAIVAAYRITGDTAKKYPHGAYSFDPREMTIGKSGDVYRLTVGLQEVAWGEAFGIPIVDVVNPYDLTAYSLGDPSATRIPVAMANASLTLGAASLQLIVTPYPRRSPRPDVIQGVEVARPRVYIPGKESEGGLRLGFLTDAGFDVKLFYYRHWNRFPAYRLIVVDDSETGAARPMLLPVDVFGDSSGLSFSQGFTSLVLRGDVVAHRNVPQATFDASDTRNITVLQTSLGGDVTSADGHLTFGLNVQGDHYERNVELPKRRDLSWAAARLQANFFSDLWHLELFELHGLNNADAWMAFSLKLTPTFPVSISLRYDEITNNNDGDQTVFAKQKKLWSTMEYKF